MEINNIEMLTERERKLARKLLDENLISAPQFEEFLAKRARMDAEGKARLGDMLIKEGYITREDLDEFFLANNRIYLDLLGNLAEGGFLSESQYQAIIGHQSARTNVVAALENLNIMTRDSFIRHCSNRANLIRLGEWLLMKGKIAPQALERALVEQHVNNLEDYILHHKLVEKEKLNMLLDSMSLH